MEDLHDRDTGDGFRASGPCERPVLVAAGSSALQTMIGIYGGFLVGLLTHAWWSGDDDLVFWPWSLAFLLMLAGWLVLQPKAALVGSHLYRHSAS